MYLNPFRDFVNRVSSSRFTRKRRRGTKVKARHSSRQHAAASPFNVAAEVLETRSMLSGPALITIAPNTGGFITNGTVENTAPTQLTFTFSPSAAITNTQANLSNISVSQVQTGN